MIIHYINAPQLQNLFDLRKYISAISSISTLSTLNYEIRNSRHSNPNNIFWIMKLIIIDFFQVNTSPAQSFTRSQSNVLQYWSISYFLYSIGMAISLGPSIA